MDEIIYIDLSEGQSIIDARILELKELKLKMQKEENRCKKEIRQKHQVRRNEYLLYDQMRGLKKRIKDVEDRIKDNYSLLMLTGEHEYQLEN